MDKFSGSITTKDAAFRCSLTSPACTSQHFNRKAKYGETTAAAPKPSALSLHPVKLLEEFD
ncbi:MAG: hypothetical protein IT172_07360 [Acidobacteria bacterium]|nr:hypothetical protein [Acidobacteriota bacterium]